ncbi:hypothetical protein QWY86_03245 [Pedobacter aquatilis]|uniref:hypothetical protein n=1 Tax=Pedobacter aquatilis TaxID=351343 RepID=UPI0025B4A6B1|nr:hypothetical protein [Pedobacter aquatilis]MDN3585667.1 hypothetical protein [Pedobacter aquatilis]
MKDILELFFSRTIFRGIAEWIGYSFKAVRVYSYWSIPLYVLVFGLAYLTVDITQDNERLMLGVIAIYLLTALPATYLCYQKEMRLPYSTVSVNFAIVETIMISERDYLTVDFESSRISEKQFKFFQYLAKKEPFAKGIVYPWLLRLPKLFYISKSIDEVKSFFRTKLGQQAYVSVLIVSKESGGSRIEFDVLYDPVFMNDQYLAGFWSHFNVSVIDQTVTEEYILEVSKVFSAQMGQCVLDMATREEDYLMCHRIIDDCQDIFERAFEKIKLLLGSQYTEALKLAEKDMLANMERYRATTYINQREFQAGIRHLFKAIKLNPYFPYSRYEEFREAYNRKYVSAVAQHTEIFQDAMVESEESQVLEGLEKFVHPGHDSNDLNAFPFTPFFEELLTRVIQDAASNEINQTILEHLNGDFAPAALSLILKGELHKFMEKGTEKHNAIYLERIPEVIAFWESALVLDPDFILLHGRIGTMMMIQALDATEDQQIPMLEAAFVRMKKGKDVYTRLGYDIGPKA